MNSIPASSNTCLMPSTVPFRNCSPRSNRLIVWVETFAACASFDPHITTKNPDRRQKASISRSKRSIASQAHGSYDPATARVSSRLRNLIISMCHQLKNPIALLSNQDRTLRLHISANLSRCPSIRTSKFSGHSRCCKIANLGG